MHTIVYVRWSSAEQSKGDSKERQLRQCHEHAERRGWQVAETIVDEGVSAFTGDNRRTGKLAALQDRIDDGEFTEGLILLVERLDRLSREQPARVFSWLESLTNQGVTIATVDGDRTYRHDNLEIGAIIEMIVKAGVANDESAKKSDRIASSWRGKRARLAAGDHTVMTARAPAWLTVSGQPRRFEIVPHRASVVRRIFESTAEGYGKHFIARRLNEEHVPTFGRATSWHASYIQKILNSPAVHGEFQPGTRPRGGKREPVGDSIPDYFPPVVDAEIFARARLSMQARPRLSMGRGRRLANLFSGMATCAVCGGKMTLRANGVKLRADGSRVHEDYLVCDRMQRGVIRLENGRKCHNNVRYKYRNVENGVLDAILADAVVDRHFAEPKAAIMAANEYAKAKIEVDRLRSRMSTALEMQIDYPRPEAKAAYANAIEAYDAQERKLADLSALLLKARGSVSPEAHKSRIESLRAQIEDNDEDIRYGARVTVRLAISELVREMTFHRKARRVSIVLIGGVRNITIRSENSQVSFEILGLEPNMSDKNLNPKQFETVQRMRTANSAQLAAKRKAS